MNNCDIFAAILVLCFVVFILLGTAWAAWMDSGEDRAEYARSCGID